jgi:hypothetical protein
MSVAARACGYAAIGEAIMGKSLGPEAERALFLLLVKPWKDLACAKSHSVNLVAGLESFHAQGMT